MDIRAIDVEADLACEFKFYALCMGFRRVGNKSLDATV